MSFRYRLCTASVLRFHIGLQLWIPLEFGFSRILPVESLLHPLAHRHAFLQRQRLDLRYQPRTQRLFQAGHVKVTSGWFFEGCGSGYFFASFLAISQILRVSSLICILLTLGCVCGLSSTAAYWTGTSRPASFWPDCVPSAFAPALGTVFA